MDATYEQGGGAAAATASLDPLVAKLVEKLKSRDLFTRAMTHYVVTELVAALTEADATTDTTVQLPLSGASHQTTDTTDDNGFGTVCTSHFISAFGHQLVEWQTCDEVVASGSGHITAQIRTR
jgi:hypothetical protein